MTKVERFQAGKGLIFALVLLSFISVGFTAQAVNATTTAVSCVPNPVVVGQTSTCTATVTDTGTSPTPPTGTITFSSSGTGSFSPGNTCTLSGTGASTNCSVDYIPSSVGTGTHTITASYPSDTGHSSSSGNTPLTVSKADTTTTVNSSANPSVFGQSVTFTATVAPVSPGTGTPGGTVTFKNGGTTLGTGTLSGGQASFSTSALSVGTHTITADYAGDANFNLSSGTLSGGQVVSKADTTTTMSSSANPSVFGQSVTFTATVAAVAPGAGTPSGTVTFKDGTTTLGTGTLNGSGQATFGISSLSVGTHTITADYGGDANFNLSSGTLSGGQTVNKADTTTTVSSSANPSVFGQSVTFTATVAPVLPGAGTPTGTVTFKDGATTLGTGTLNGSGQATFSTSALSVSNHAITADYAGDANFNLSSGTLSGGQTVNKANTTTTITSDTPDPTVTGEGYTASFTVTANAPGAGTPSGNVTVSDGTDTCVATVTVGSCTLTSTTAGAKTLTATYAEDANFNGSASAGVSHTVNKANTTTAITSDTPDPSTAGQTVTVNFTVSVTSPGSGTPTGNVTVSDGTDTCVATVAVGSCTLISTTAGAKTLTATYAGDANFNGSVSVGVSHTVNKANTTTAITSDTPDPSTAGQAVTVNFTVSVTSPGSGTPTANVTVSVSDGSGATCVGTVAAGTCTITLTKAGNPNLTATYAGDTNFNGSASANELHTVNPAIVVGAPTLGTPFSAPNFVTSATGLTSAISGSLNTSSCRVSVDGSAFAALSGTCATPTTSTTIGAAFTATGVSVGDGAHTVRIQADDTFGNTVTSSTTSFTLDDTAPDSYAETLGSPNFTSGSTIFVKSATNISVGGNDGTGSGIASCTKAIDGGAPAAYTLGSNFNLPASDVAHTYDIVCTDNLGNVSPAFSRTRTVDDTAPDNYAEVLGSPNFTGGGITYVRSTTNISVNADDGTGSGIASCQLQIAGGSFSSYGTVSGTPGALTGTNFDLPASDGAKSYDVNCTDQLGNTSGDFSKTRTVDDTPPGNYAEVLGSPNFTGGGITYVKSTTNISVNADDGTGSGIASCQLQINGGGVNNYSTVSGTPGVLTGTNFNLPALDGPKSYNVNCTDQLGNTSTNFSNSRTVDDTPPTIASPRHQNTTCFPTAACAGANETIVAGTFVKANNQASVTSVYPSVPASTFDYPSIVDPMAGTNPGSGLANCTLSGTQQNGTYTQGANFNIDGPDGADTFSLSCDDHLGNNSVKDSPSVNVDDTPPVIPNNLSHDNTTCWPFSACSAGSEIVVAGTWVKAKDRAPFTPSNPLLPSYPNFIPKSTFQWKQTDAGGTITDPTANPASGLRDCVLTGGTTQDNAIVSPPFAGVFSATLGDGSRTFRDNCRDNLGNQAFTNGATVNVDDTPPIAIFTSNGPRFDAPDGVIFVESNTLINVILADGGVGVDLAGIGGPPADTGPTNPACRQNVDQDPALTQPCQTLFSFPPPDQDHSVWTIRPDLLGNVAESRFPFVVDDTAPQIKISTPVKQAQYLLNSVVLADWKVSDNISFFNDQQDSTFNPGLDKRGSGIRSLVATTPSGQPINTQTVGAKSFSIIATDNLGHQNAVLITYNVVYKFDLAANLAKELKNGAFQAGETIPLRFTLGDANDVPTTGLKPLISLIGSSGKKITLSNDEAAFNEKLGSYEFDLDTASLGLPPDTYQLWIQPGDGTTHKITLVLR